MKTNADIMSIVEKLRGRRRTAKPRKPYTPCPGSYADASHFSLGERTQETVRCPHCAKRVKLRRTIYGTVSVPRHKEQ